MKKPITSYNWPDIFFEQYHAWLQNHPQPVKAKGVSAGSAKENQNYAPLFMPVYPPCPYLGSFYPAMPVGPVDGAGQTANPGFRQAPGLPNAYILFLIFILIMLGTRREKILAVIRKIFQ